MLSFLGRKPHLALSLLLMAEAAAYIAYPKQETVLLARPLSQMPVQFGRWKMILDAPLEREVLDVLRADDTLNRFYADTATGAQLSLYVAFFKTQTTGVAPHSPKVCLPGEGFEPSAAGFEAIAIPGRAEPIVVNHYVVARGDERRVVLYWYQTHNNVIASEYSAKINTLLDSMRYHRSDTAIVRVVAPVQSGLDAEQEARRLAAESFEPLRALLPQ
jgi:EpsI family protein